MSKTKPATAATVISASESLPLNPQAFRKLLTSETSRQTSLLFTAQLLSSLLNFVLTGLNTHLDTANYGVFIFCWSSVILFLNFFFEFGIFAAGSRLLAIERGTEGARRMLGALMALAMIIGVGFSITIAVTAEFFQPLMALINNFVTIDPELYQNTQVKGILLICAPLCAVVPLQLFLDYACQGLNRIGALSLLRLIIPGSSLAIVAALFATQRLTIVSALLAQLVGYLIACVSVMALLKPGFSGLAVNISKIIAETRRFGFDIYFGRITTMISTRLDGVLIPIVTGTTALGFYNIAQKLSEPLTNLSRSLATTRFKNFANEASVKRSLVQLNLILMLSGTLALILLGPYLFLLLPAKYAPAAKLILPFAVGAFFGGLFQPYNGFLSAHGRGGELRNISIAIGFINVISLIVILPRFGVMGVAWMVATASALNFSLHYYYYRAVYHEQANRRAKRVTMIDLSNDAAIGLEWIREQYGEVELELVNKEELRTGSQLDRLRRMRGRDRDIFVIFCDRLEWQTRRTPMLIFGLLAGSEKCWLVDSHKRSLGRSRLQIILLEFPHVAIEAVGSFVVVGVSWFLTSLLEMIVKRKALKWQPRQPIDNQPLRINFIRTTPTSGAQTGGSNSHITGFTKGAVALGAKLSFISNDAISGINKEQTPIEVIEPSPFFNAHRMIFELWNNLTFTARALGLVRKQRPDFLYQRYSRFSWAGVAISYITGIPLILEYNGSEVWIGRHWDDVSLLWLLEQFEKLNLLGAQMIFVVSAVEKENLKRAGVPAEKVFVNPNGVDPEMFKPGVGGKAVREDLGIDDKTVIGFVGTFGPWHGVLALAEAIVRLPAEANCHFLLVGEGSLKPNVEKIVAAHNCQDRVTFTGRLSHRLVPSYLDACDILVSPHVPMEDGSDFFGSPTKLFEYMAMSKPIVASRLGQIADVIVDNLSGRLIEPGNIEMLTTAIRELAADAELRARMGEQARVESIANYTWTRNAGRVIEAYLAAGKR